MSDMVVTDELVKVLCGKCGITFAFTKALVDRRRDDHEPFYCPNGHPRAWNAPKVDPRDAKIADLTDRLAASEKRAAAATETAKSCAAWIKRAPHLASCNVRVDRPCDCGRAACGGDVDAPEVTSAN